MSAVPRGEPSGRVVAFGAWAAVALVNEAGMLLQIHNGAHRPMPLFRTIVGQLAWVSVMAALTPFIAWTWSRARPLRLPLRAGVLVLGCVATLALHQVVFTPLNVLISGNRVTAEMLSGALRGQIRTYTSYVGIYAGTVAAIGAWESARRARRAAREAARLEAELAGAELSRLTMRLDPDHFFSRLDQIVAHLRTSPIEAENLVVQLGDALRRATEADLDALTPAAAGTAPGPRDSSPRA